MSVKIHKKHEGYGMKIDKIQWLDGANKAISMSKSSPNNEIAKRYFRRLVRISPFSALETKKILSGLSLPWQIQDTLWFPVAITNSPKQTDRQKYRVVKA